MPKTILITGGAGFVGSSLGIRLKGQYPEYQVIAFDNLKRRGSELNLARLRAAGISWENRKAGVSKLKINEMGTRYFFILLYCLIEKYFSRGDFKKKEDQQL